MNNDIVNPIPPKKAIPYIWFQLTPSGSLASLKATSILVKETMPTNACQYFYECGNCKKILQPTGNDCCVYCSYGTVACPPIQLDENCC